MSKNNSNKLKFADIAKKNKQAIEVDGRDRDCEVC